jgi:iron complex transport system ATP-binding protein
VPLASLSAAERAQRIAYVPQRSELGARLSVQEVVALGRYAARSGVFALGGADRQVIDAALERVRASALAARPYPELSGGEQRLVLLARALATGARTVLLDEPALSLDIRHGLALFELLRELASQAYCVVCVLHDLDEVRRFCDAALLLEGGRARFAGAPEQAAFATAAERVYGVRLVEHDRLGFRLPLPEGAS